MSLRDFHLLFIALAAALAVFCAAWAAGEYRAEHQPVYAATAVASVAAGAGLLVYARAFRRKTRDL
jgi:hypothetical protein